MNSRKLRGGRRENLGSKMVGTSEGETVENSRAMPRGSRNTYHVSVAPCDNKGELVLATHLTMPRGTPITVCRSVR